VKIMKDFFLINRNLKKNKAKTDIFVYLRQNILMTLIG